jgi:hypothetical protein
MSSSNTDRAPLIFDWVSAVYDTTDRAMIVGVPKL